MGKPRKVALIPTGIEEKGIAVESYSEDSFGQFPSHSLMRKDKPQMTDRDQERDLFGDDGEEDEARLSPGRQKKKKDKKEKKDKKAR
eukprot:3363742-Amphidinium_carterae.1